MRLSDQGRRVGHYADHARRLEALRELGNRHSSRNRHEQLVGRDLVRQLGKHCSHALRFGGQEDHRSVLHDGQVAGERFGAGDFGRELLSRRGHWVGGHDLRGLDQARLDEALGQGPGHLTRADESDGMGGHRTSTGTQINTDQNQLVKISAN